MHLEWWQECVIFHQRKEICYLDFKQFTIAASLLFYIILFWVAVIINGNRGKKICLYNTYADIPIFLIKAHLILKFISTENIDINPVCTRHKSSLYPPLLRLTKYQKGVYYTDIKIYNCLPLKIKELSGNLKHFKKSVKKIPFTKFFLYYGRIP